MELQWVTEENLEQIDFLKGAALMIDKPLHLTSFNVVYEVRKVLRERLNEKDVKVGHSGTLDPLATGLMILCTGKSTKKLGTLLDMDKEYRGNFCLGAETKTYDAESEPEGFVPVDHIEADQIQSAFENYLGTIIQKPPLYSAAKVKGKPLYKYARAGQDVKIRPRQVTIYRLDLEYRSDRTVHFTVRCSKGTYIRSLVHNIGQDLGVGAYLTGLRRRSIGPYRVQDAWDLNTLIERLGE